jgi:hypothetical protein
VLLGAARPAIPGGGGGTGDRNLAASVPLPRDDSVPWRFGPLSPGAGPPPSALYRIDAFPGCLRDVPVDPTWNEHPLRSLSGATGRLAHRFSLPIRVGMWGLLGLAYHRVPPTGQARPIARLQVAKLDDLPAGLVGGRVPTVSGPARRTLATGVGVPV